MRRAIARSTADEQTSGANMVGTGLSVSSQGSLFKAVKMRTYKGAQRWAQGLVYTQNCDGAACDPDPAPRRADQALCDKWAVITTIFEPTVLIKQLAQLQDWCVVVVGDKKSPTTYDVAGAGSRLVYLTPDDQMRLPYKIVKLLKWNHFGRKNIGFLYALHHGAQVIYDTDDDNIVKTAGGAPLIPVEEAGLGNDARASDTVRVDSHVYNPYNSFDARTSNTNKKEFIWPRGFPLDLINDKKTQHRRGGDPERRNNAAGISVGEAGAAAKVTIVQSLADHDPDVDGLCRLTRNIPLTFRDNSASASAADIKPPRGEVLPSGVLTPFNAQAVLFSKDAFWGLLMPVTVHGRVTDIWRSYFTQRLLWDVGQRLAFTTPFVTQCRNPHSYLADFDAEADLYERAGELVRVLLEWQPRATSLAGRIEEMAVLMYEHDFLHKARDVELYSAWLDDLHACGYDFPPLRDQSESAMGGHIGWQPRPPGTVGGVRVVKSNGECETESTHAVSSWGNSKTTTTTTTNNEARVSGGFDTKEEEKEEAAAAQQCQAVKDLYAPPAPPDASSTQPQPRDRSKDRILVIAGHGAPLSDTIADLLFMGWPADALYTDCKMYSCFLTGTGSGPVNRGGMGSDYWKEKRITGVELGQQVNRVDAAVHDGWIRGAREETLSAFAASVLKNTTHWDGGEMQRKFDATVGNALDSFSAVVCPFCSYVCAPFLDARYSHLKVITRASHRFDHKSLPKSPGVADFMRRMLRHMAENPSRFLVSSNNAFDMAVFASVAAGKSYMLGDARVSGFAPIPALDANVLFWPSYYRHAREWSPPHRKPAPGSPARLIEIGAGYRMQAKTNFEAFTAALAKDPPSQWRLATIAHQNLSTADLAIIHPYSVHSAKVNELYAIGVPMLAPSVALLAKLAPHVRNPASHVEMSYKFLETVMPETECAARPEAGATTTTLEHWTAWFDAFTHPHLFYFDSYNELRARIDAIVAEDGLLETTRQKMRLHWDRSHAMTKAVVSARLDNLLEGRVARRLHAEGRSSMLGGGSSSTTATDNHQPPPQHGARVPGSNDGVVVETECFELGYFCCSGLIRRFPADSFVACDTQCAALVECHKWSFYNGQCILRGRNFGQHQHATHQERGQGAPFSGPTCFYPPGTGPATREQLLAIGKVVFGEGPETESKVDALVARSKANIFAGFGGSFVIFSTHHKKGGGHVMEGTIAPIFIRDEYGLASINLTANDVVLDIGGHVGTTAIILAKRFNAKVLTFEPVPETHFYLRWNALVNRVDPAKFEPYFGGVSTDGLPIDVVYSHGDSTGASVLTTRTRGVTRSLQTFKFSDIIAPLEEHGQQVGLLKLDCEGCEYDLVPSNPGFFSVAKIRAFRGEIHAVRKGRAPASNEDATISKAAAAEAETKRVLCALVKADPTGYAHVSGVGCGG